ncbi:MAG: hypothetical protein COB50_03695 [Thiotrichales bacterium]|nr:MAG: hypothetical protein COB50_03695 [Thiotrichales bacterium]
MAQQVMYVPLTPGASLLIRVRFFYTSQGLPVNEQGFFGKLLNNFSAGTSIYRAGFLYCFFASLLFLIIDDGINQVFISFMKTQQHLSSAAGAIHSIHTKEMLLSLVLSFFVGALIAAVMVLFITWMFIYLDRKAKAESVKFFDILVLVKKKFFKVLLSGIVLLSFLSLLAILLVITAIAVFFAVHLTFTSFDYSSAFMPVFISGLALAAFLFLAASYFYFPIILFTDNGCLRGLWISIKLGMRNLSVIFTLLFVEIIIYIVVPFLIFTIVVSPVFIYTLLFAKGILFVKMRGFIFLGLRIVSTGVFAILLPLSMSMRLSKFHEIKDSL